MTQTQVERTYPTRLVEEFTNVPGQELRSWAGKGYLPAPESKKPGSGHPLEWNIDAVLKAEIMGRLVKVGFQPGAASAIASVILTYGEGIHTVDLGSGIFLHQDRSTEYMKNILDLL